MDLTGVRFSQLYMRRDGLEPDSVRMRNRLAVLFSQNNDGYEVGRLIKGTLGLRPTTSLIHDFEWANFLAKSELRDVLDIVTLAYHHIGSKDVRLAPARQQTFLSAVARIFAEEQVGYRVDEQGVVHYAVDQAFEHGRQSAVLALSGERFNGVRTLFEDAYKALDKIPPDGKAALRFSFFATESLFRLMFQSSHQLSAAEVQKHLEPFLNAHYAGQKPAVHMAQKLAASFRDWIDGAHFYRHEPGAEEPAQPPIELAIYMVSEAAGHLRWLAQLDQELTRN
jgi:hypothetical protein